MADMADIVEAARMLTNAVADYRNKHVTKGCNHTTTRTARDKMYRALVAMDSALEGLEGDAK